MKERNNTLRTALLASGSLAGYNIGSGFATGLEGQQFFAAWGNRGAFISLIIALVCTSLAFIPVYLAGFRKKNQNDYNIYHYYCGDKLGILIDWYMYMSLLLVILMMMSGAGATINQYFGIPKIAGVIILSAACITAALLGLEKLMHILSYAGVVIIAFVLCCALYLHFFRGLTMSVPREAFDAFADTGKIKRISILGLSSPLICGISSAGLLIVSSMPWVASTGALCENKTSAVVSGAMSGLLYFAAQGVVVYLNLVSMDRIAGAEVPLLAVFQNYVPSLAMIYSFIIILAIFSTVSGRLFLVADRFDRGSRKLHNIIIIFVILVAAVFGTYLPFSAISNFMFTFNGCLGIFLGFAILIRTLRRES